MRKNLIGERFGRWFVIDTAEPKVTKDSRTLRYWLCLCDCGTKRAVKEQSLKNGRSKSCGCYHSSVMHDIGTKINTTHGMSKSRLYGIFKHMHNRCSNTKDIRYAQYGGRGVFVTSEWNSFEAFRD